MSSNNKRRRTTTSNNNGTHITDLPAGILVGISSYLAKPSAVLFALSMTADSDRQIETETSKAIISAIAWNVFDFGDIERDLAAKLSDDHIDKILRCIDAVSNLRILKLGGCVKITGSGLDTLRSSIAIQQIDMSLVGKHEVPLIEPEPLLSEDVVLPMLHSIISGGTSLKQLEFPKKWRDTRSTQMDQFLELYNDYLRNQRNTCSKCDRICVETGIGEYIGFDGRWYGSQNYTCSGCLNYFCFDSDCLSEDNWCRKCEKEYCKSCSDMTECSSCPRTVCNECNDEEMKTCEGEGCERILCEGCSGEKTTCYLCGKMRCRSCTVLIRCSSHHCKKGVCEECLSRREREVGLDEASNCECGEWLAERGYL